MIQSYEQLQQQVNLVPFNKNESTFIQKIYSSSYYLCLSLRYQGKTNFLYIGRGAGHEGVWFSELRLESFLRKRDKFLEYIRKHLSSTSFAGLEMDRKDRIFKLKYHKWGRVNSFYYFYNARNLYFANHFYDDKSGCMRLFKSWTMKNEDQNECDFEIFNEIGRKELSQERELRPTLPIHILLKQEKDKALKIVGGGKSKKFLNRKLRRIEGDLQNTEAISELSNIANSSNLNLMQMKNKVGNIRLNFKTKEHFHRRDEVFTKIKKLKKAKGILELRKKDTEANLSNYSVQAVENQLRPIAPMWKTESITKTNPSSSGKLYKILQFPLFQMGIGTTAQANDQLRSEWAKKNDIWFHLDGDKSPHIIIKGDSIEMNNQLFTIVGSALLKYSGFDYLDANLIYTPVKNLKGVKGTPGKVIYKKEKRISIQFDPTWDSNIL